MDDWFLPQIWWMKSSVCAWCDHVRSGIWTNSGLVFGWGSLCLRGRDPHPKPALAFAASQLSGISSKGPKVLWTRCLIVLFFTYPFGEAACRPEGERPPRCQRKSLRLAGAGNLLGFPKENRAKGAGALPPEGAVLLRPFAQVKLCFTCAHSRSAAKLRCSLHEKCFALFVLRSGRKGAAQGAAPLLP